MSAARYAGGVAGENDAALQNCYNTGTVTATGNYAGGIVGNCNGAVENCYNTANVSGKDRIGGVAGNATGSSTSDKIQKCYNTGNVTGKEQVGGVAGHKDGASVVQDCYNAGDVTGTDIVGGVTGYMGAGKVLTSYSAGKVTCTRDRKGGVVGSMIGGTVQNCYYDSTVASNLPAIHDADDTANVRGLETGKMTGLAAPESMAGFAFDEVWYTTAGYPKFEPEGTQVRYTVTFKVKNGQWDAGGTGDKVVTLSRYENEDKLLKLEASDIPAVGNKPAAGYKEGSWDVTPTTEMAISENKTYTYTYAKDNEEPVTIAYAFTSGSGQSWKKDGGDLSFTVKRTPDDSKTYGYFESAEVDGKTLTGSQMKKARGSLILTLKASYLKDLKPGMHTLRVLFRDGTADATFTVQKELPVTGDAASLTLWLACAVVGIIGLGVLMLAGKCRKARK